jgi:hypothetical protein
MRQTAKFSAPFIAAVLREDKLVHLDSVTCKTVRKDPGTGLCFIPLPRHADEDRFLIPPNFPRRRLSLHIPERFRGDGGATVVCGFRGARLRSYLPEGLPVPWHITGWVRTSNVAFVVTAYPHFDVVRFTRRSVEHMGRDEETGMENIRIRKEIIFEGQRDRAINLKRYKAVIDAAFAKAEYGNPEARIMYYHDFGRT